MKPENKTTGNLGVIGYWGLNNWHTKVFTLLQTNQRGNGATWIDETVCSDADKIGSSSDHWRSLHFQSQSWPTQPKSDIFFEIWQCAEMQLRPAKQLARNGSIVCGSAKHLTFQLTTIWQWTNKKQKLKSQFGIRVRGSSVDWGAAAGARLVEEQTGGGTKRIDGLWLPLVYPPLLLLFSCPFYLRYLGYLSYLIFSS